MEIVAAGIYFERQLHLSQEPRASFLFSYFCHTENYYKRLIFVFFCPFWLIWAFGARTRATDWSAPFNLQPRVVHVEWAMWSVCALKCSAEAHLRWMRLSGHVFRRSLLVRFSTCALTNSRCCLNTHRQRECIELKVTSCWFSEPKEHIFLFTCLINRGWNSTFSCQISHIMVFSFRFLFCLIVVESLMRSQ